ncbi:MAG: shikimate kinase [Synechococcus sp. SB0673_bin_10]|nr:shikimate kinase [Cyanobacteria bacterium MAG IRC1_bin_28]MXY62912.1 shikimate kinase [Synechococcus sp. SB0665_bin_28]MYF19887.1 shikimate kinase [Synechococcus sp. SB0677_bin_5]MYF36744.1 shikimate kinase [Synechococcus sp. SB0678_bin_12]MYG64697.1 shikimate kinase [Synechococcus sp. SB0675_bin_7]MYI71060.1 shikimate kinase [Synechococcus sp. SB0673_bin_10]MYK84889.1 shikimate kinase [Synechococcus sp. SB0669_bin_7]
MNCAPQYRPLRRRLAGANLYLVGMMGCGKSSTGKVLARKLGYRWLDADQVLETAAGHPIPALFAQEGEEGFREMETDVLRQIGQWHSCVVSTGGGVVIRPANWGIMRQGVVVWLAAAADLLLKRLRQDPAPRPLLQCSDPARRLEDLLAVREPLYAQADMRIVQTGTMTSEAVAAAVLTSLATSLPPGPREIPPRGGSP